MKITKRQLRRIIREGIADDAYEAGYNDALRDRPHGSNPDMRDLDPRSYDHGFDKGTAERMDLQRPSGTRGFYEGAISKLNENYDDTLAVMKSDDREAKRRAIFDFVDDIGAFSPSDVKALLDATFDFLGMGEEQAYMHMLFIDSTLPIGAAVDGLRQTADEDFDPDRPR